MATSRRKHSPSFKAKVALAAIKGDKTIAELAQQYNLHPTQINEWKRQLSSQADSVFGAGEKQQKDHQTEVKALYAKVGKLTLESDFLSKALRH